MHYQILINKGTNLWSFMDEGGFWYAAETEAEMAEKVRELVKTTPMDNIKVVAVLDTEAVVKVESLCPEPEEPETPENPDEPVPDNPENPDTPETPDTPTTPDEGETTPPETGGEDVTP